MAPRPWHVYTTDGDGAWTLVASLPDLVSVAGRIAEQEFIPDSELTFEIQVPRTCASERAIFSHLIYRGRHGTYIIERAGKEDPA